MALTRRQAVLAGLLIATGLLTLFILRRVFGTVFFAITVAYVLYPLRQELVRRGAGRRVAAALATTVGFLVAMALVVPVIVVLYVRQAELLAFIRTIPAELPVDVLGWEHVIDVNDTLRTVRLAVQDVAVDLAGEAPVIGLKLFLFTIVVFGLLLRPGSVGRATFRLVPGEYHDIALALHRTVRDTLYALYVLQAATAGATFAVAYVVFWLLGYDAAFTLAFFSGLLQFIPVIGPSLLVAAIAGFQVMVGDIAAAILVSATGFVLIGFLPDALVRPRLARLTTGMPASLYFVGFTGGTLSLGVVGVIAGPLVIALLVDVIDLVADEQNGVQSTFDEVRAGRVGDGPERVDGGAEPPERD